MLDSHLRPWIDPPLDRAGRHLAEAGFSADTVTVVGFALGMLGCVAIALEGYGAGLLLILLNRVADGLDGAVARHRGATDRGAFLDIVLDFIFYSGVVFAFALADPTRGLAAAFLIFSFIGTGCSFLAYAIIAAKRGLSSEAQGKKSIYYLEGLTEGSETIGVLVLLCLLPDDFTTIAVIFGLLCWLSTVGRIIRGVQDFAG